MFADNNLLNFEVLILKMSKTSINHLTSSDNAITCIEVRLINMIARERENMGILLQHIGCFILITLYLYYTNLFLFIFHF